jgi:hypothetical protein
VHFTAFKTSDGVIAKFCISYFKTLFSQCSPIYLHSVLISLIIDDDSKLEQLEPPLHQKSPILLV